MIILNLKGGLGNQMFQYALGRSLSLKNNDALALDLSHLTNAEKVGDTHRAFALEGFAIQKNIASPKEVQRIKYPFHTLSKIARRINQKILRNTHVGWEPRILKKTGDIYLDGYWQSPRYFTDIRDVLLKEFTPNDTPPIVTALKEHIMSSQSVSLHVRRGDYVTNPRTRKEFGICSIDYYRNAARYITQRVASPHFFIFSDDIAWAKENLPLTEETTFVDDPSLRDVDELFLMSTCAHNIIANSSFSWWGAWLNDNPEKIVIAPQPWFDTVAYDPSLIPESWIQIQK